MDNQSWQPPSQRLKGSPLGAPATLHPLGVYSLSGLAVAGQELFAFDQVRGYLLRIDPQTQNTEILNPFDARDWAEAQGLALWENQFWLALGDRVLWGDRANLGTDDPTPLTVFTRLPYEVQGIAVCALGVYVTCRKSGYIHRFSQETGQLIDRFPQPGVGSENLTVDNGSLWVCDRTEQSVYQLDPHTGEIQLAALTPFHSPTAIAFYRTDPQATATCYIAYAQEEPYIRDDPNSDPSHQLTYRDRTFIHPLHVQLNAEQHYTLSNGYRVELTYVEEIQALDPLLLESVEWRIALPSETVRQQVRSIRPVGHPFTLESEAGQQVAVFKFDQLHPGQGGLLGWQVVLDMYGLKYTLTSEDVHPEALPPELAQRYLVDDDDLAMDKTIVQKAAKEAVGTETHVLRKMLRIRNYVYDRLTYSIRPRIDTPDIVLDRGSGSCGEYVGVLLALARLNGIACRTIGRYKCPAHPDRRFIPLEPDFNHVWLEFYLPGVGWLPMESNVDGETERGPYPTRFFMGLAWFHTELGKGIKFEKLTAKNLPEDFSLGNLALNHIRFRILEELAPESNF
ncbi:transglutaminase domain-containing protein [Lyngbya confervoides]|uniref:Transglutaminase n=1 Tax=Lyngbya confervoides BDU141951 TaxID=1574623 RepID=A0ABD4T766_9CYAN|nr:transglutaminase domain-containing protein [Lyngbya confervoides]MCM1984298.1 transglutaminase [Lyngbya confervoides BDU141951]